MNASDYHERLKTAKLERQANALLKDAGLKPYRVDPKKRVIPRGNKRPKCTGCGHNFPKRGQSLCGMCKRQAEAGVVPVPKVKKARRKKRAPWSNALVDAENHMRAISQPPL